MKTTVLALLLLAACLASPSTTADTRYLYGLGEPRYHHVSSEIVGRSYHVFVGLPAAYEESEATYPTLYLLDGGALFPMMAAYYRSLRFAEETPDLIIVGISYGSDNFEGGNFRSTDYTAPSAEREYWGGAGRFQQFLKTELMPMIEESYRSEASRRIIFGQSIGGQFVLYTAQTDPGLFWGHIASNPALHRNLPFYLEERPFASTASSPRLFVASATGDDPRFREPAQAWIRHWHAVDVKPWDLKTVDLEGHSHMSAPPAALRQGLMWLFDRRLSSDDSR